MIRHGAVACLKIGSIIILRNSNDGNVPPASVMTHACLGLAADKQHLKNASQGFQEAQERQQAQNMMPYSPESKKLLGN